MKAMLIAAGLTASYAFAGGLPLCLQNEAALDSDTVRELRNELALIVRASNGPHIEWTCDAPNAVQLKILAQPPAVEFTVLGAARVNRGRVQPEIELYATPIARLVGNRLPVFMGRALARVSAHELGHYFTQTRGHSDEVMSPAFSGPQLLAMKREHFRVPGLSVLTQGQ